MKTSNNNIQPKEILKYINTDDLHQFIINYGAKHPEFMEKFMAHFSPKQVSAGKKDYTGSIMNAFGSNTLSSGTVTVTMAIMDLML